MARDAWWAPWGFRRVGHDLATKNNIQKIISKENK